MSIGIEKYPHLFSPLTIRGKVYKNRMIAAPTMFVHASYFIPQMKENLYRMVERRAAGGFACVSTGEMPLNFEEAQTLFQENTLRGSKPKELSVILNFPMKAAERNAPKSPGDRKTGSGKTE